MLCEENCKKIILLNDAKHSLNKWKNELVLQEKLQYYECQFLVGNIIESYAKINAPK